MERNGDEVHVETDEARGASTPNIVRWVLLVSLFAAIALLSIIWITGAATQGDEEEHVEVTNRIADTDDGDSTDSIVGENADELETAEPGEGGVTPTVENRTADAPLPDEGGAQPAQDPETARAANP
jgi:hypothetical protein